MSNTIISHAISALIALGLAGTSTTSIAESTAESTSNGAQEMMLSPPPQGMERCYGVAKAGQNNCGTASHNCAGEATINASRSDWMLLPDGLCKKIVGGNLTPENKS
jgi:uncharacterized membrane protein